VGAIRRTGRFVTDRKEAVTSVHLVVGWKEGYRDEKKLGEKVFRKRGRNIRGERGGASY